MVADEVVGLQEMGMVSPGSSWGRFQCSYIGDCDNSSEILGRTWDLRNGKSSVSVVV